LNVFVRQIFLKIFDQASISKYLKRSCIHIESRVCIGSRSKCLARLLDLPGENQPHLVNNGKLFKVRLTLSRKRADVVQIAGKHRVSGIESEHALKMTENMKQILHVIPEYWCSSCSRDKLQIVSCTSLTDLPVGNIGLFWFCWFKYVHFDVCGLQFLLGLCIIALHFGDHALYIGLLQIINSALKVDKFFLLAK
jgi:hypothetical protein